MKIFKLFLAIAAIFQTLVLSGCTDMYSYDSGYNPGYSRTIVHHQYPYYPRHYPHVRPVPPTPVPPPYPRPYPHVRPMPIPPTPVPPGPRPYPHVRPPAPVPPTPVPPRPYPHVRSEPGHADSRLDRFKQALQS